MTDVGYGKGIVCEILGCTPSEVDERCKSLADIPFLIEYHNRKTSDMNNALK